MKREYKAEIQSRIVPGASSMWIFKNLDENSKSKAFSDQRESSEHLGRYLQHPTAAKIDMDNASDLIPAERYNEDGVGGLHMFTLLGLRQ